MKAIGRIGLIGPIAIALLALTANGEPILIGSKKFTESYVLAEIAKHAIAKTAVPGMTVLTRLFIPRLASESRAESSS